VDEFTAESDDPRYQMQSIPATHIDMPKVVSNEDEGYRHILEAIKQARNQDIDNAVSLLHEAVESAPSSDIDNAVSLLQEAVESAPSHTDLPSLFNDLGTGNVRLQDFDLGSEKPAMTNDLSPDDIIIACVIACSYFIFIHIILNIIYLCSVVGPTGSGKSTVRLKFACPNGLLVNSASIVHKCHHRIRDRQCRA
jgi:hypothetical protein